MNLKRLGLKALGLYLVAALSVLALISASAQAEVGSKWLIEGATLAGSETIEGEAENHMIILSSVGKTNTSIAILCKILKVTDGLIFGEGSSLGTLTFSECNTTLGGVASPDCKPEEPIVTVVKDLLILHNGKTYDLFSPDNGGLTFVELGFLPPCSLPERIPVEGHFVLEECSTTETLLTEKLTHLLVQAPDALFPLDKLRFGQHAMSLDGSVNLRLSGANKGKKWSGHAA